MATFKNCHVELKKLRVMGVGIEQVVRIKQLVSRLHDTRSLHFAVCSYNMEKERDQKDVEKQKQAPNITPMTPVTHDAYGGGMYGTDDGQPKKPIKPPASETQSADGPVEATTKPKQTPPPSSGDRDIDITGQSYIQ